MVHAMPNAQQMAQSVPGPLLGVIYDATNIPDLMQVCVARRFA